VKANKLVVKQIAVGRSVVVRACDVTKSSLEAASRECTVGVQNGDLCGAGLGDLEEPLAW